MTKQKNIGLNAFLNVVKQSLSVLFPLITYPYALRTLGAEGIGKVTYAQSIIGYFSLIAMLGVTSYAIREGAKRRNDKEEFSKFANEIFTLNMMFTIFAYVLLIICAVTVHKFQGYGKLLMLLSLSMILTTLGVDWMNTVFEDYWLITIRSIIIHIASLVVLFLFVHSPSDYYVYALISVMCNGIVCVINWFHCRKYSHIKLTFHPNFKKHIRPLLILFANAVAISIYVNFDTTMLGWIKGDYYVGLYAISVKIYTIIKNLLVAVYSVSIPRLAFYIGSGQKKELKKLYTDMWGYLSVLLVPASIGLVCVSPEVMYFMGGEEFSEATLSLQILSIGLIFAIFGGLVTACLNVTIGREKENLLATIIGAILNFALNLVCIPFFMQNGAALTTLISEAFVFLFCFIRLPQKNQYIDTKRFTRNLISVSVGSGLIVVYSFVVKHMIVSVLPRLVVIVVGSVFIYLSVLVSLKNDYVIGWTKKIISKVRK